MNNLLKAFTALLLILGSPAFGQEQAYYDNVVIVLDASGSMAEEFPGTDLTKWTAAVQALNTVVGGLSESTRVGLFIFADDIAEGKMSVPLGPKDEKALALALSQAVPYGVTPLGVYLKYGSDALLRARADQHGYGSYRLLVVTDGQATDEHLVAEYTPDLLSRGIILDVVGVAMSTDHTLKKAANSYRSADDPKALVRAVQEIFAEVSVGGDNHVGDDAFEILESVPVDFAMVLLKELTTSYGNHPIGASAGSTFEEEKPQDVGLPPVDIDLAGGSECSVISGVVGGSAVWVALLAMVKRRRETDA